jgi:hypothetical protein
VLQAQPGNTVDGNAQVPAGASGAGAAPAAPPAPAPGAVTEQNRSLPLSLSQLSDLHKVPKRREIGARDDEQVGIPAQRVMSQHAVTEQNRSLPLSLSQLSDLHKVPKRREIGARDDEQVGIPAQHILKKWLPYLQLKAHRETEEYFERSGLPAQSAKDFFKFKRAAFHGTIKRKTGLAFTKAAAMRVIMHIDKSPAIVLGRPARSSQQHVPRLLSSALHHNYHLPSQPPRVP